MAPTANCHSNGKDRDDDSERAGLHELARNTRTHNFSAAHFVAIANRGFHARHGGFLRGIAAGLQAEAQNHFLRRAEALHLYIADAHFFGRGPQLSKIGNTGVRSHFDDRAARKIDAEIHADRQKEHDGQNRHHRRERIADAPEAHEAELGILRRKAKQFHAVNLLHSKPRECDSILSHRHGLD